tara:strand:- start:3494 stop:5617 length:2124 start_codon:yes stop_codon:yes gene_type:complete
MASNQDVNNQEKLNKLLNNSRANQKSYNDALKETKSLSDQLMFNLQEEATLSDFKDRRLRSEKDLTAQISKEKQHVMKAEGNFGTLRKKQMAEYRKGNVDQAVQLGIQAKKQGELIKLSKEQLSTLGEELSEREEVNKKLGVLDNLVKGLDNIPFVGAFIDAEAATEAMEENIRGGGKAMGGLLKYTKDVVKENIHEIAMVNGLNQAKDIMGMMLDGMFEISEQTTAFNKDLGLSNQSAASLRSHMAGIALSTDNVSINSNDTIEAFHTLNDQFGTAATTLRSDIVAETATLMKLTDMSAQAAGRFAMQANITGQNMSEITDEARAAVVAGEKERGIRVNINKVLDEAGQTTGVIAANLGYNVQSIAKAITVAKQFGLTLSDLASISSNMLDFQSSIEAELQAELFTGKQLNLEKARLASLTGDYETLTKEIMKNVGSEEEFARMNVLQKEKMAQALGMNVDQLSDLIFKEENLSKLAQDARDRGDDDLADSLEKRDLQNQMNDAIEKMQTLFLDLAAGPLGTVANMLLAMADNTFVLYTTLGLIAAFKFASMIAGAVSLAVSLGASAASAIALASGLTLGIAAIAIVAGIALAASASVKAQKDINKDIQDGIIDPEGGLVVSGPKGSIQLDKDDSIIAGTNLGGDGGGKDEAMKERTKRYQAESIALLKRISVATAASSMGSMVASVVYSGFDAVKADTHYGTKFK